MSVTTRCPNCGAVIPGDQIRCWPCHTKWEDEYARDESIREAKAAALRSAEREVLEACVAYAVEHFEPHSPEREMADQFRCGYGPSKESVATTDALRSAVRRYRALLQEIQKSP